MIRLFKSRILPAVRNSGFSMQDYWIWRGSPAQGEDGRFHLFASGWPKHLPFHPNWVSNSEVVRAVADHPEDPYSFQEVVLPPRAGFWDATMTHNPTIHKPAAPGFCFTPAHAAPARMEPTRLRLTRSANRTLPVTG